MHMVDLEVRFRPLEESDFSDTSNWRQWISDNEITRYQTIGALPQNSIRQMEYIKDVLSSQRHALYAVLAVTKDKEMHIGNVGLHNIDYISSKATLGIVIGSREFQGRGIGTLAWGWMTSHGHSGLNLNRIEAYIHAENVSSRRAAEKSGFREEGRLRDYYFKNGDYSDAIIYSRLRSDN